jgi:hypothetical protein
MEDQLDTAQDEAGMTCHTVLWYCILGLTLYYIFT